MSDMKTQKKDTTKFRKEKKKDICIPLVQRGFGRVDDFGGWSSQSAMKAASHMYVWMPLVIM